MPTPILMPPIEYSPKELELIRTLSPHLHALVREGQQSLVPYVLYRILAEKAFIDNSTGPAVDSLRRVLEAINKGKPYRMTQEFDDLIRLGVRDLYVDPLATA